MAATELFEGSLSHHAGALRQAMEKVANSVVAVWTAYRNRRAVNALMGWDAHMLRDIGLNQSDIESALTVPLSDDPSSRLVHGESHGREARLRRVVGVVQPGLPRG